MSLLPPVVERTIESFEKLPGIGPKSAQRLVFYLLHMPKEEIERFAARLIALKSGTTRCSVCQTITDTDPCSICGNGRRDHSLICVVEQPTDILSIEKTGAYSGVYHVLHGVIDPLNNIGPEQIFIDALLARIKNAVPPVREIIFALNSNMEGEATIMYIQKQFTVHSSEQTVKVTRLAHGLPMGGDIEYADEVTLKRALEGRREY